MYSYFAFIKIYFYFSSLLGKSNLNVRMKTLKKNKINMLANLKATPSLMPILDLATRGKESGADAGG